MFSLAIGLLAILQENLRNSCCCVQNYVVICCRLVLLSASRTNPKIRLYHGPKQKKSDVVTKHNQLSDDVVATFIFVRI